MKRYELVKSLALFYLVAATVLTACQPSPDQIQAAIEKTLTAAPTYTFTFIPSPTTTSTFTSTATLTPSATPTPTDTPNPTATPDLRIIEDDPMKYLLKADELPLDAKYYIPGPGWMSINTNEEVVSGRGVEAGRDYVIKTGRITGWWVQFKRGTRAVSAPDEVFVFVGKYQSAAGAQLALHEYNDVEVDPLEGWKYKDVTKGLGDDYVVYSLEEVTSGGDKHIIYCMEYTYRNFLVQIILFGYQKDISHDYALIVGNRVLEKLQEAPLIAPPSPTPTP